MFKSNGLTSVVCENGSSLKTNTPEQISVSRELTLIGLLHQGSEQLLFLVLEKLLLFDRAARPVLEGITSRFEFEP